MFTRPFFQKIRQWWSGGKRERTRQIPDPLKAQPDKSERRRVPKWKPRICRRGHTNLPAMTRLMRRLRAFHRVFGYTDTHVSGGVMPNRLGWMVATQPPVHPLEVAMINARRNYSTRPDRRERRLPLRKAGRRAIAAAVAS